MMKTFFVLCFISMISNPVIGQQAAGYDRLTKEAFEYYNEKEFLAAARKYSEAFRLNGDLGLINDRYLAACSWAMTGETDSAFYQLFRIAQKGDFDDNMRLANDSDLNSLQVDPRWQDLMRQVLQNKERTEKELDRNLVATLDTILTLDQKYRRDIKEYIDRYGVGSDEVTERNLLIQQADSINLNKVQRILDERGWPGSDKIGNRGSMALFLVIQHAPVEVQEKYLPGLREAVMAGKIHPSNLALLEDRIAIQRNERQKYGSQIGLDPDTKEYYILPLDDPMNVDQRRTQVGLPPIKDYVLRWGIEWDPEEYLRILPEIESRKTCR
jgi:hypothetical protein